MSNWATSCQWYLQRLMLNSQNCNQQLELSQKLSGGSFQTLMLDEPSIIVRHECWLILILIQLFLEEWSWEQNNDQRGVQSFTPEAEYDSEFTRSHGFWYGCRGWTNGDIDVNPQILYPFSFLKILNLFSWVPNCAVVTSTRVILLPCHVNLM